LSNTQNKETFFSIADRVGTFLFANFIWVILSVTVIGIPFATAGIFSIMNQWVQGRQPEFFRVFGGAIRDHWRKILWITLLDVAVGGLLFINFSIFRIMEIDNFIAVLSSTMTFCATIVFIMVNLYIWSYISLLDLSVRNLIKLSLILGLTYPFTSLGMTLLVIIPIVVSLFLPIAFFLFLSVSTVAYIGARGAWYVLNKHFPPDELEEFLLEPMKAA